MAEGWIDRLGSVLGKTPYTQILQESGKKKQHITRDNSVCFDDSTIISAEIAIAEEKIMEDRQKIEVYVGLKPGKDQPAPDAKEIGETSKPFQERGEVEGQYPYWTKVVCPHCYAINEILANTSFVKWFRCWQCGGLFTY